MRSKLIGVDLSTKDARRINSHINYCTITYTIEKYEKFEDSRFEMPKNSEDGFKKAISQANKSDIKCDNKRPPLIGEFTQECFTKYMSCVIETIVEMSNNMSEYLNVHSDIFKDKLEELKEKSAIENRKINKTANKVENNRNQKKADLKKRNKKKSNRF